MSEAAVGSQTRIEIMKKELFQKLAMNLAKKYTTAELQQMLIQRKDDRISKAIVSALNKKAIGQDKIGVQVVDFDYYDFLIRTVGPESSIYELFTTVPWDEFQRKLSLYKTEKGREGFIYSAYIKWRNAIAEQNEKQIRYCLYIDKKREEAQKAAEELENAEKLRKNADNAEECRNGSAQ